MVLGKGNVLKQQFIHLQKEYKRLWIINPMIGIFFYLTKAYNILNHKILLDKQYSCGIRGSMNSWFQSYLAKQWRLIEIHHSNKHTTCVSINIHNM